MGISTVASYTGAQVFEAVGLGGGFVDEYFTGTTSKLGGIGLDEIADEVALRHRYAHFDRPSEQAHRDLWVGGEYQWRREGEYHLFNPDTVFKLQHSTRARSLRRVQAVQPGRRQPGQAPRHVARACSSSRKASASPSRSKKCSRSRRS